MQLRKNCSKRSRPDPQGPRPHADGKLAGRNTTAHINIVTKEDKPGIDIYSPRRHRHRPTGLRTDPAHRQLEDHRRRLRHPQLRHAGVPPRRHPQLLRRQERQGALHPGITVFGNGRHPDDDRRPRRERLHGDGDDPDQGHRLTYRDTQAHLSDGATLIIKEKIMTHGHQHAETNFSVDLDGYDSSTNVISRSVAKDHSSQMFNSNIWSSNLIARVHCGCDHHHHGQRHRRRASGDHGKLRRGQPHPRGRHRQDHARAHAARQARDPQPDRKV